MGDRRYERPLQRLRMHGAASVSELSDEDVIAALAALVDTPGPDRTYLSNVLATEAMNRISRARAAITHVADAILTLDKDGICVASNPAASAMLGWSEGDLRGLDVRALLRPDGADHAPFDLDAATHEGLVGRRTETLRRKDGTLLHVSTTAAPVRRDGDITGAVVTFHERTA